MARGGPSRSAPREALRRARPGRPLRAFGRSLASFCCLGLYRQDTHGPAAAPPTELHLAVNQGEQGVVPAPADTDARMEVSAVLTHDDLAGANDLAAEPLHAQPLCVGVAPVPAGGRALLVCHLGLSPSSSTRRRPWPHRYRSPAPACTSGGDRGGGGSRSC